jgi:Zn-dependent protease
MHAPLAFIDGLFISLVQTNPVYFFSWVLAVIVSVVLHELGHGFAALSQGDGTPREEGHMTWDPMVHMGTNSIIALFVFGLAWGAMPVRPHRFRGKYGDAIVAFAGPAVNLLLAIVSLTVLALWLRTTGGEGLATGGGFYIYQFLFLFGMLNIVLCLFNLLPLPPLDGATVLGNFAPDFKRFAANPDNQPIFMGGFILVFFLMPDFLWPFAMELSEDYIALFGAIGP